MSLRWVSISLLHLLKENLFFLQCKAVVVDSVISKAASSGNTKALEAVMTNQNGSGPNNDQIWQVGALTHLTLKLN